MTLIPPGCYIVSVRFINLGIVKKGENPMTTKKKMNSLKKTAIVVGFLFIIATAFLFIGEAFYKPILSSPDYLEIAYPNRTIVTIGILLEFIIVLAIPLIPVFLFPVLKQHNETLALGYVVFRLLEAVILISVAEINKLSLIGVSQAYLNQDGMDAAHFQHIGSAIQAENYWGDTTGLIYNIVFVIGALMLYSIFYQSKLIPRWISVWGFIAAAALLTGAMLSVFGNISPALTLLVILPIAVQEMVMAGWLIVKGFNPAAIELSTIDTESGRKDVNGPMSPTTA
jgi:hypothetical protein